MKNYDQIGEVYINILTGRVSDEYFGEENEYNTALIDMAKYGNVRGVMIMLENGANINISEGKPLREAIKNQRFDVIKFLIEHGATVEDPQYGVQPIDVAARAGNLDIIKYLVEHGANPRINDDLPFAFAIGYNHLDLIPYFESLGATIYDVADQAFVDAAREGHINVLEFLIDKILDPEDTIRRAYGGTIFALRPNAVEYLLQHGAKIREDDLSWVTRSPDTLKILLKYKWTKGQLNYAFLRAIDYNNIESVKLLLGAGADLHHKDDHAFLYAARRQYLPIVQLLVNRGANIRALDDQAIKMAKINNHQEIYEYLRSVYEEREISLSFLK